MSETAAKSVESYQTISERIVSVRMKATPVSICIVQVYAPTGEADIEEVEKFYKDIEKTVKTQKKWGDVVIIMRDFNAKIGMEKVEKIVGPFGLGTRNGRGDLLVEFCKKNDLSITNTWFEQRESARHTWRSPDGVTRNQIDYVLINTRYKKGVRNSKSRPGADCGSDHNPVVMNFKNKLKAIKKRKTKVTKRWNLRKLKESETRERFVEETNRVFDNTQDTEDTNDIWRELKEKLGSVADMICGKLEKVEKQDWMTVEILNEMKIRSELKSSGNAVEYKKVKKKVQKLCRDAKNYFYQEKCKEIEELDRKHNTTLMYSKIKQLTEKKKRTKQGICDKDGNLLMDQKDILNRWAEYVEELYDDRNRTGIPNLNDEVEMVTITEKEVKEAVKTLSNERSPGEDEIPAALIKNSGERCITLLTKLINKIYQTGEIPTDLKKSPY